MRTPGWSMPAQDVSAFLRTFEHNGADPGSASGEQFAESFLVADPTLCMTVTREQLVAALPARKQMFDAAGVGPAQLQEARQLDLDERHLIVSTTWEARRADREPVRLESSFLLRRDPDGLRIVAYVNHHDIASLLSS